MIDLSGRRAVVTGGGRGIGRGIALVLARSGADLALADLDLASAESTAREVEEPGRRTLAVAMDVTQQDSIAAARDEILRVYGGVDILVNNAGVVQDGLGDTTSAEDFGRCYQVNQRGIWAVSQAFVPGFRKRGGGRIVNIASIAGRQGGALAAYSASKAAAISLTQSLAGMLGPDDINVNAVCPGLLWTPMWEKLEGMLQRTSDRDEIGQRAAFEAYLKSACPLRREQTPEDIGNAVAFLASDLAANITGQALNVDGGIEMS